MKILLSIIAILFAFYGWFVLNESISAIQQTVGVLYLTIAAIFFCSAAIIETMDTNTVALLNIDKIEVKS